MPDYTQKPGPKQVIHNGVEIVILEKSDGGGFAKSYKLDTGRNLIATPAGNLFSNLTAQRVMLDAKDPLGALSNVIGNLQGNQALALGRVPAGVSDKTAVPVILDGQDGAGVHGVDWTRRTAEDFSYEAGAPAMQVFDFDVKSYPRDIAAKVKAAGGPWEAVLSAVPELRDLTVLKRPSTSTGIVRASDNHTFPGGGWHVYLLISDGIDADTLMKTVRDRLWETGFGYVRVVGGGRVLKWSIIDHTIWMPQQPIYEAPPVLGVGLKQLDRVGQVVTGTKSAFDVKGNLKPADTAVVDKLFEQAKASPEVQAEIKCKAEEWVAKKASNDGITKAKAQSILDAVWERQKLPLETVLVPLRSGILGCPMVLDVVEDLTKWDHVPIADPIEGTGYGSQTAKIFANLNSGQAMVHSMAHGGIDYELHGYGVADVVEAVRGGLGLDRVAKAIRMPQEDVLAALAKLADAGVHVDAGVAGKANAQASVETQSRKAKAVLDFIDTPMEAVGADKDGRPWGAVMVSDDFKADLKKIAQKETHSGGTDIQKWLGQVEYDVSKKAETAKVRRPASIHPFNSAGELVIKSPAQFVRDQPEGEVICERLGLEKGSLAAVTAQPGNLKTGVMLELAFVMSNGETLDGVQATRKFKGLFLAGENNQDTSRRLHLTALERNMSLGQVNFDLVDGAFSLQDHFGAVQNGIAADGYEWVIVDTATAYNGAGEENQSLEMQKYWQLYREISRGPGSPLVVVLTHPPHGITDRKLMRPRGSSAILGTIDANLTQELDHTSGIATLHYALGKFRGEPWQEMNFQAKGISNPSVRNAGGKVVKSVRAVPLSKGQADFMAAHQDNQVLAEIAADPKASQSTLAKLTGQNPNSVRASIKRLVHDGKLIETLMGKGKAATRTVTDAGARALIDIV